MNNTDHISESFEFFDANPGSRIFLTLDPGLKKFGSGIRDKHPGSATLKETVTIAIVFNLAPHPELVGHLHLGSQIFSAKVPVPVPYK